MNLNEAKKLLERNGYVCESMDDVINFIYTGAVAVFSPLLRVVSVITDGFDITYGMEDELVETLERAEYSIFKKIISNKFLKLMFKKLVSNDNLRENFKLQPDNGLFIKTWTSDVNDTQFKDLLVILKSIAINDVNDVRPIIQRINEKI